MNYPSIKARFISFLRVASAGLHNLFRNAWLTTAAIAVMIVTLTIIQFGFITYATLDDTIEARSKDLTVAIFLNDADESAYSGLRSELVASSAVEEITFKSKAEALRNYQDRFGDTPKLLEGIGLTDGNPLPASFEVVLNNIADYQAVIDIAHQDQYKDIVDSAEFSDTKRDAFTAFINLRRFFGQGSIIAGAIFGLISVLVIFNTIRMAIFTRSVEVEIMKLIGATRWYIKGPFLVEAILYGLIASILSLVASYSAVFALNPIVRSGLESENTFLFLTNRWYVVAAGIAGFGIALGYLSSSIALSRYLRLKKW